MDWQTVARELFPAGHTIVEHDNVLLGTGQSGGRTVTVVGTTNHTSIGVEIALSQARAVLDTVRDHPGRPIVILVDTQGQRLRRRDEMLGINACMAHLGKAVDLARRRGHKVIGLVYDQALSGGFITSGLLADVCFALPASTIRVMALPAMARITKVPEERLIELARSNPVFAPGAENYLHMGAVAAIWSDRLADRLADAIASCDSDDRRAQAGIERGGRKLAWPVMSAVRTGSDVRPS
jgi:malonate decarboxylase gamma subunit